MSIPYLAKSEYGPWRGISYIRCRDTRRLFIASLFFSTAISYLAVKIGLFVYGEVSVTRASQYSD